MARKKSVSKQNQLKMLREFAGFSQTQLSRFSGISVSTIRKLESGERSLNKMSLETAFKLAVVLQVPLEFFLDTSDFKLLNKNYVKYWNDYLENLFYYCCIDHKYDNEYIPYSEIGNPYVKLYEKYKEIENKQEQ